MQNERFSLMTFSLARDIRRKTICVADMFQLAAKKGIPLVDAMHITKRDLQQYLDASKETGIGIYCYIATVSFFKEQSVILKTMQREINTANALGAKLFMVVPFFFDERKARKMGREKTRMALVRGFRMAVEMGNKAGLTVCFETTPKDEICLSGTEDCRWMLEQVPGLCLVFDTANMLPHGDDPLDSYEALKEHVIHVHLKDVALSEPKFTLYPSDRTADGKFMTATVFGEGVIPVKELHKRMLQDGYKGKFAIEYVRDPQKGLTPEQHMERLNRFLKNLEE